MSESRSIKVVLKAEITDFKRAMSEAAQSSDKLSSKFDANGQKINTTAGRMVRSAELNRDGWEQAGRSLTVFGAVGVAALGLSAKAALDWESAWTGVLKTVEGTPKQLGELEGALRDMALRLPASAVEIAGVAEAAGQLGVKVKDVAAFTEVMINLGETTNLTAEEAATALARIANIMGTTVTDISRMGAAIVDLGNNSATTEREIVDFSTRLAAAAKQAGLSEPDMLAFASAMTSVGVEAEAGGTAMSKVFTSIADAVRAGNDDLTTFAKVAGVSTAEFKRAFEEDAATAISMFLEGMGKMSNAGESTTAIFDTLDLTDQRLMRSVLSLGSAEGLLADQLAISNQAWDDNTALIEEANKRYDTTEAKVAMARNALNEAAITIGEDLLPMLAQLAEGVASVAGWFADLPDPLRQSITGLTGVVSVSALAAGGFLMLFPRVMDVYKGLKELQRVSPGAASGIGKVTKAAGVAAAVLAAMAASSAIPKWGTETADGAGEATLALLDLAEGASVAETSLGKMFDRGGFKDWFTGNDVDNIERAYDVLKDTSVSDQVDNVISSVLTLGQATSTSRTQSEEFFKSVDEGLASLVQSGAPEEAARALAAIANDAGVSINEVKTLLPGYTDALAGAESQTKLTAGATGDATDATDDYADALTKQIDLQREAAGVALAEWDALGLLAEAVDAATAAVEANGQGLDANTEAGRANRDALAGIVTSTYDWVEAGQAAGASSSDLNDRMVEGRTAFIRAAEAMGLEADEAMALADEMNLIPTAIWTKFQTPGLDFALSQVNALNNAIRRIPGSTRYTVEGSWTGGSTFADGGPVRGPGTGTSDSIPARLSNGEHVWTAREVQGAGGHNAVASLRSYAAKGFAEGGGVYAPMQPIVNVTTAGGAGGAGVTRADLVAFADRIAESNARVADAVSSSSFRSHARSTQLAERMA